MESKSYMIEINKILTSMGQRTFLLRFLESAGVCLLERAVNNEEQKKKNLLLKKNDKP